MNYAPLVFEPILKEKVWGGRRLEDLGKWLPPGAPIGETWEIADLAATSPSGGGGDPAHSLIANGPLRGRTLREAMRAWGDALMGDLRPTPDGGFPLLVKFLDAHENLSVQVHPSPVYAAAHPEAHLKTESWFVVGADPGGVIYAGVRPGATPEEFRRHVEDGTVAKDLNAITVKAGDCFNLPSGVVHALGAGVLVAEVQTPSDTTYRVFDWGRTDRELHITEALACIDFAPQLPMTPARHDEPGLGGLIATDYFNLAQLNLEPNARIPVEGGAKPVVWMCIRGTGAMAHPGLESPLAVSAGLTLLLPAALGLSTLTAGPKGGRRARGPLPLNPPTDGTRRRPFAGHHRSPRPAAR